MERAEFLENLQYAAWVAWTRTLSDVPDEFGQVVTYCVRPCGGFWPTKPEWEPTFAEAFLSAPWCAAPHMFAPLSADEVAELLWRDGKVPLWIDIDHVIDVGGQPMAILLCSRIRTAVDYYYGPGFFIPSIGKPPFLVNVPSADPR